MMLSATFNNSSVILWRSDAMVEYPVKITDQPQVTDKFIT